MVCAYNNILFSHKEKGSTEICYNMDEPQNTTQSETGQVQKENTGWFHL